MSEKCSNCDQILKEDKILRKAVTDTNRSYVDVVNENLALRRKLEEANIYYHGDLHA